jgi:hypothetical protein
MWQRLQCARRVAPSTIIPAVAGVGNHEIGRDLFITFIVFEKTANSSTDQEIPL